MTQPSNLAMSSLADFLRGRPCCKNPARHRQDRPLPSHLNFSRTRGKWPVATFTWCGGCASTWRLRNCFCLGDRRSRALFAAARASGSKTGTRLQFQVSQTFSTVRINQRNESLVATLSLLGSLALVSQLEMLCAANDDLGEMLALRALQLQGDLLADLGLLLEL